MLNVTSVSAWGRPKNRIYGRSFWGEPYILKRGLTDLTLRPLAAALDTSPRMLLYFFGSKERLITEALAQTRTRQQQEFVRLLATKGNRRERLALAWDVWSSEENKRFLWFLFEV